MKKKVFILTFCHIFISLSAVSSSTFSLIEMKKDILLLLKETGDVDDKFTTNNLPSKIIVDRRTNTFLKDDIDGIFYIPRFGAHRYAHYLLINNKGYQIINMRNPLANNLKILLAYLEGNKNFSKEDILFYINDLLDTYQINERGIKSEGIYIEE